MQLPSFAEELKFQTGGATRVVTVSLKARAAITMAGHKGDAVTWFDASSGSWVTSPPYGAMPFVEEFVKQHPAADDYGKTWALSLPESSYLYDGNATGAATVEGWSSSFPHPLRGLETSSSPDAAFYSEWSASPFADTYLTKLAEASVDSLGLGKGGGTDYLAIGYSSVDYVGHTFGPRSWEIQDILVRLDQDLSELFTHLDGKVGKGNYVAVLTADHGVAPIPDDMKKTGFDAGVLNLAEVKDRLEKALEPFNYAKPAVRRIAGNELYFSTGVYEQLKQDPAAMKAVIDAALATPGVAAVYRAEELTSGSKTFPQTRRAAELNYFAGRSGDLYILQKPYWLTESSAEGAKRYTGTGHGTPYFYDQRVPLFFLGFGIAPGEYFEEVTPADIAPTLGALTGITLATSDGRILREALEERGR
jgi:predicted AlkP superfamily pyrophosphatase or phosphodiesterase